MVSYIQRAKDELDVLDAGAYVGDGSKKALFIKLNILLSIAESLEIIAKREPIIHFNEVSGSDRFR